VTDLSHLNDAQREAVLAVDGPVFVSAGAGSGKTRTLTHRLAHMIESGIAPENIFAGTFTEKAASEMKSRLTDMIGEDTVKRFGHLGTLHSFGAKVLLKTGNYSKIIDAYGSKRLITDLNARAWAGNPIGRGFEFDVQRIKAIIKIIDQCKNNLITAEQYAASDEAEYDAAAMYSAYEQAKAQGYVNAKQREKKAVIDFGDMLIQVYYLFKDEPSRLHFWQSQFTHVLVDEAQDNNSAQYAITEMIAAPQNNIMIVGDHRQSIYGFRGAQPASFAGFTERYPSAQVIDLDTNYRSTPEIVELGDTLIANATDVTYSKVKANRPSGQAPVYNHYEDETDEGLAVAQGIQSALDRGISGGDIAVIYRTNKQSRSIEDALVAAGIKYQIVGSGGFYNRSEVKVITGYLMLAVEDNYEALKTIINKPTRYLANAFADACEATGRESIIDGLKLARMQKNLSRNQAANRDNLINIIQESRRMVRSGADVEAILRYIVKATALDVWLAEQDDDEGEGALVGEKKTVLDEVIYAAQAFETPAEFIAHVKKQMAATNGKNDPEAVTLITGHRSKGLEWKIVFVIGMSQGLVPHFMAENLDEERRWAYTALTRAADELYMSSTSTYNARPAGPSPFIGEMMLAGIPQEV
jgi:DNA helicase-2/ATP-dependent DNA helicase PcrA